MIGYLVVAIGLFFYSFTQVDLALTLSKVSFWQVIEKYFQNIGYFQRPLSSYLFLAILTLLFLFYIMVLREINKRSVSKKAIWTLIFALTLILTFSYNAFSYDLFNYIFDAKIITYYHQNPYIHKALDFLGDPMLSFMHWTHRVYPYGPVWLGLTVPLSFVGMQVFLPTFFLFKIFTSACFLGVTYFIGKVLGQTFPKNEIFGIAFFALNPLVIIESLVSSHNDISMMFFAIFAIYLLINSKYIRSTLLLLISIGIKFSTAFLAPIFALIFFLQKRKRTVDYELVFVALTIFMIFPVVLASFRTTFQPWYLLEILPFAALVGKKHYVFIPSVIVSFFATFQYLPFLYTGNWDKPIPSILFGMLIGSLVLSIVLIMMWSQRKVIK